MKIWLKFLIGTILGITLAFVFPFDSEKSITAISFLTEFSIRFGRYMLIPLLFFSVTYAVFELRESHELLKTGFLSTIVIVTSSLLLTFIGIVSILLVRLPRIPITTENVTETISLNIPQKFLSIFPYSVVEVFHDANFLLPVIVFACFAGAGCAVDKAEAKNLLGVINSASRVCWAIMSFFLDMLAIGMIAITCKWTLDFYDIIKSGTFNSLILLLTIDFVIVVGGIYPLLLYFICKEKRPYRVLYASICSLLLAFFSGDANLTLVANLRHAKESLGLRRRINSVVMPAFSIFARGGSALVMTVSFIFIMRWYSSLSIALTDILWLGAISFGLSFVLGAMPTGGAYAALTIICTMYGRGYEAGFLLLKPAAGIICAFAALFDAATSIFGSYLVAKSRQMVETRDIHSFI